MAICRHAVNRTKRRFNQRCPSLVRWCRTINNSQQSEKKSIHVPRSSGRRFLFLTACSQSKLSAIYRRLRLGSEMAARRPKKLEARKKKDVEKRKIKKKKIIFLLIRAREDIVSAAVEHPTLSLYKNKGSIIYQKKRNEMYWRAAGAFVSGWYGSAHRSSIFRVSWCLSAASICVTGEILSLPPPLQGSAPPFCFMRSFVCWWISPSSVSFPPRTNASLNIKTFWGQSFSSFFFFGRFRFTRRPSRWRRTSQPFPRRNHRNLNDAERGRCAVFSCLAFFESAANPWLLPIQRSPGQNGSIFCISVIVIYSTSPVLANDPQFLHFFFIFLHIDLCDSSHGTFSVVLHLGCRCGKSCQWQWDLVMRQKKRRNSVSRLFATPPSRPYPSSSIPLISSRVGDQQTCIHKKKRKEKKRTSWWAVSLSGNR